MKYTAVEKDGYSLIKARSDSGLEVCLSPIGASIVEIRYAGAPMTIAPKDLAEFTSPNSSYFGKTVGRIAGRIKDSKIDIDGKSYQLEANEGPNCLHGGPNGLSNKTFKFSINEDEQGLLFTFTYDSPDGEGGFPGMVAFTVNYLLYKKKAALRISYRASSDKKTLLNLTNHSYFNLGGSKHIGESSLFVNASNIYQMDSHLIPSSPMPVSGSLDLRHGMMLKDGISDQSLIHQRSHGYDHIYILDEAPIEKHKAVFSNQNYCMELFSDYKAVVVYSDNYPRMGRKLTNGHDEIIHAGLALEFENCPGDIEQMEVAPGKQYNHFIEYSFSKKKGVH